MHQKLMIAAALAFASAATDAAWSQSPAEPAAQVRRFTLIAPDTEQTNIDLGKSGPSQGDLFIFSGPLQSRGGGERGRLDGHCITVSTPDEGDREQDRRQCFLTSTLGTANGETEVQAQGVGRILAEDVLLSVTGSTKQFRRVRGQVLVDYRTKGQVTLRYELITAP